MLRESLMLWWWFLGKCVLILLAQGYGEKGHFRGARYNSASAWPPLQPADGSARAVHLVDYTWRVWSSYSLDACHQGRIELHFSGLVLQLGIVLLVFGSKGRSSTGYVQMMLSPVVSSIRTPCFSKALQADSGTNLQHYHLSRFTSS